MTSNHHLYPPQSIINRQYSHYLLPYRYFADYITAPFSTLWVSFAGFGSSGGASIPLYAEVLGGFVVVVPSLDVMTSYAMMAGICTDHLLNLVYGHQAALRLLALRGKLYVFCYTIVLPSFLVCDVSVSLLFSISACLHSLTRHDI